MPSRHDYPPSSYSWRRFYKLIQTTGKCDYDKFRKLKIRKNLPKRIRSSKRNYREYCNDLDKFHNCLFGKQSRVYVKLVPNMGLGIFARKRLKKDEQLVDLPGARHMCSKTQVSNLEHFNNETCFVKMTRNAAANSPQRDCYLSGTLALLNHSCTPNAKMFEIFRKRGKTQKGHGKHIDIFPYLLRTIRKDEQICLDYGESWWNSDVKDQLICKCNSCSTS